MLSRATKRGLEKRTRACARGPAAPASKDQRVPSMQRKTLYVAIEQCANLHTNRRRRTEGCWWHPHAGNRQLRGLARRLNVAGIEHDANLLANGGGREIIAELGLHNTRVTVRCNNLTPQTTVTRRGTSRGPLLNSGLVDVRNALANVERGIGAGLYALDLQARLLHMLVLQVPLETNHLRPDESVMGE
jgi:hypothetical protein